MNVMKYMRDAPTELLRIGKWSNPVSSIQDSGDVFIVILIIGL